ncbi:single-stranded DNA-binding protein [Pseudobacteriovorax antillogorgiicola]|uniref:Single-stranded DNA-binding protein n=1 Tax=Pseudobacteriovorax antillogorgiicola TaxID=1513793 RepID=A0A1Y6CWT0_9BACT|nr:single-stranded DNA-binding protein [Pseudobacteriovorax antillogorgiicola]TCS44223.1 single-strand binding protein [Pseudobacteriovorax antillogorgiicola]SMF80545.1 single-strand DNA-binding protein [Pseudobacteriovorax antillogorgiicola]
MASINKAIILGNLGQDPDLNYTASGAPVCTLSIATNETRTDAAGNRKEASQWHRVIVWNKQAENCAKYLAKGRTVYVEGRIQTRSWQDKHGQKRYSTEVIAQTVQFIGGGQAEAKDTAANFNPPADVAPGGYDMDVPF